MKLEPDRIFVRDGDIWTSAGITAGIDLALAMIAEDFGEEVARQDRAAARALPPPRRRPVAILVAAGIEGAGRTFRAAAGLGARASRCAADGGGLAEQAGMSPRHFTRAFVAETGMTPAKAVERLRIEAARQRVQSSSEPIERVAETTGFRDPERMRRAFIRAFGQPPQSLRRAARAG